MRATPLSIADDFEISTDRGRLDLVRIEQFLRESYWSPDRARHTIEKSVENSLCLGAYRRSDGLQVGLCRVVTDYATFGVVEDVFVDDAFRGQGIGKWMIETLVGLPELAAIPLLLQTADAHGLYAQFGFEPLGHPERWMFRSRLHSRGL